MTTTTTTTAAAAAAAAAQSMPRLAGEAGENAGGRCVADAMITCPTTHDLGTALDDIRAFFDDGHVHMALIVSADGRLITTIERPDLAAGAYRPVAELGSLTGRTAGPALALDTATAALRRDSRRRLAVVDDSGRLLGLLCLKKDGTGYCSDQDVRDRVDQASCPAPAGPASRRGG